MKLKKIRLNFLRKKTKEKKFPEIIKLKKRKTGFLGTSKETKVFSPDIAVQIYKTLNSHQTLLDQGTTIVCKLTGAKIKKEHNGKRMGKQNQGTYSIELNDKKYFVKFSTRNIIEQNKQGILKAAKIINKIFKQSTSSVKVITPHIIYLHNNKGILVTTYFNPNEAVLLQDAMNNKKITIPLTAINNFNKAKKILFQKGFEDIGVHNAFYHFETKNILLFDIMQFSE